MKKVRKQYLRKSLILMQKGKRKDHIRSKQGQYIQVNGKEDSEMDMENNSGLMVRNMLESGRKTELMVKVNLSMLMGIFMRVNGQMIKLMVMVFISM